VKEIKEIKAEVLTVVDNTTDEILIKKLWSFVNGYFSKQPDNDPRKYEKNK